MGSETQALVKHFQKVFVGPDFWLSNNCVFLASQKWGVTVSLVQNLIVLSQIFMEYAFNFL